MPNAAKNARQKAKRRALYEYFLARKLARMERKIDAANKRRGPMMPTVGPRKRNVRRHGCRLSWITCSTRG